ncbi:helix-turn-helix transcriptional regulator [Wenyingzhuangia sp. IMCC45574]
MNSHINTSVLWFSLILFWNSTMGQSKTRIIADSSLYSKKNFILNKYKMTIQPNDKAFEYFKNGGIYFKRKKDTLNYLRCIVSLSDIERRKGNYNESFELLFDMLPSLKRLKNPRPLQEANQILGILYGIYGMDSIALIHTKQAHQIAKNTIKKNDSLISSYLDVAVRYTAMKAYSESLSYLDSCYLVNTSGQRLHYVDAYYGYVYTKLGEVVKAKTYFKGLTPFFESVGNEFQFSVDYFLAEYKTLVKQKDSALYYYHKALKGIDSLRVNISLKPIILSRVSSEYANRGDHSKAYVFLKEAKIVSDSLFHIQSEQNKNLFRVKNKYRDEFIEIEKEYEAQAKLLRLTKKAQLRLKLILGVLLVLFIVAFTLFRVVSKLKQVKQQQKLNKEKNEAILEVKNKELTASALKIIEKEIAVKELLETLMEQESVFDKSLLNKYKIKNQKIWDDFDLRFTQINDRFYEKLRELHPELTSKDLKHCALIKLNFDSKEMAQLLGISINSVHMARSRIRKKIGLKREDSLSIYLSKF